MLSRHKTVSFFIFSNTHRVRQLIHCRQQNYSWQQLPKQRQQAPWKKRRFEFSAQPTLDNKHSFLMHCFKNVFSTNLQCREFGGSNNGRTDSDTFLRYCSSTFWLWSEQCMCGLRRSRTEVWMFCPLSEFEKTREEKSDQCQISPAATPEI